MTDHRRALVPISAWAFNAPEVLVSGRRVDIGLLAEALIYYEQVLVNITTQVDFAAFIRWFLDRSLYSELLSLIREETIQIYDYAFAGLPIRDEIGRYSLWNIQDTIQAQPGTFERRVLAHEAVRGALPKAREREKLYAALRGRVLEAHSDQFAEAIANAKKDSHSPGRNALIVQALVDEVYRLKHLGEPPRIEAVVLNLPDGGVNITVNVNLQTLGDLAPELGIHEAVALNGAADCNRLVWSAALLNCDLFLPRPMSRLVGDKLFESAVRVSKNGEIIESLKRAVEFPDIRLLVNAEKLSFAEVMTIRKKAGRFRAWLQDENERDRDALIAYHNEVAKRTGLARFGSGSLRLFGVVVGGGAGGLIATPIARHLEVSPDAAQALGGIVGAAGGSFITDVSERLGREWKPVVFGEWLKDRISEVLEKEEKTQTRRR